MEAGEDDMFEPIPLDEPEFMEKLGQQNENLMKFHQNQNQIQDSLNALKSVSCDLLNQSELSEIHATLQLISGELQRLLADSMTNTEMINNIRKEHDILEKEFEEFQKKIQSQ